MKKATLRHSANWVYSTLTYPASSFFLLSSRVHACAPVSRWKYIETVTAGKGAGDFNLGCKNILNDQNGAIIGNYPVKIDGGYDVTTQVRAWIQGLPNKGFALLSGIRDLGWQRPVPGANM